MADTLTANLLTKPNDGATLRSDDGLIRRRNAMLFDIVKGE